MCQSARVFVPAERTLSQLFDRGSFFSGSVSVLARDDPHAAVAVRAVDPHRNSAAPSLLDRRHRARPGLLLLAMGEQHPGRGPEGETKREAEQHENSGEGHS